ncbi:hypothetical protein [Phytohabitans rumicis]|uniref:Uncharacterized protein n=1 Tax=Phytohabitans rumicis TaxID=1076125 RepID=A0A6V8L7A6_9ACTN|nr:hypothetical protein [Phytohabitans rumicis]GFJ93143.1 hypothetical protein Prum_067850 [Phytohabitans rumicis]
MVNTTPDPGTREKYYATITRHLLARCIATRDEIVHLGVPDAEVDALVDELVGARLVDLVGARLVKRPDVSDAGTPWTIVLTAAAIERESLTNDRVRDLLDESSFGGAGARRVRRGVRATDAARAVALANGTAGDPQVEELGAGMLDLRSARVARRLRGARTLAALADHGEAPTGVRRSALTALAAHVRPHLDPHTDEPADVAAAHQALVRAAGRSPAEARYLLTYLYRDRLRPFAVDLVPHIEHGDELADLVLQRGADTIYTEAKTTRQGAAPRPETVSAAACTLWLIALTLQTATEQGQLPDAGTRMVPWSDGTIAASASHHADANPIGDMVREGRFVLVDVHRLPRGAVSRFAQRCVELAGDGAWTIPVRETAFLVGPDSAFPDGPATRRCPDAAPLRHTCTEAVDRAATV